LHKKETNGNFYFNKEQKFSELTLTGFIFLFQNTTFSRKVLGNVCWANALHPAIAMGGKLAVQYLKDKCYRVKN